MIKILVKFWMSFAFIRMQFSADSPFIQIELRKYSLNNKLDIR